MTRHPTGRSHDVRPHDRPVHRPRVGSPLVGQLHITDLHARHGWANAPALENLHLLPFLHAQARLLQDLFPRRIKRIVVFPIPRVCTCMWDLIAPFLGTDTRNRVLLVCGMDVGKVSRPPKGLRKHMDEDLIGEFERTR